METKTPFLGTVIAVSVSKNKGEKKTNLDMAMVVKDHGIENDAHAGKWHRQISLLAEESIQKIKDKGIDVKPGDFAENITTSGIRLWDLPVGTRFTIGEALFEVSQIGKKCHTGCAIFQQIGDCVMPKEGIFARVIKGGTIKPGDSILPAP